MLDWILAIAFLGMVLYVSRRPERTAEERIRFWMNVLRKMSDEEIEAVARDWEKDVGKYLAEYSAACRVRAERRLDPPTGR